MRPQVSMHHEFKNGVPEPTDELEVAAPEGG